MANKFPHLVTLSLSLKEEIRGAGKIDSRMQLFDLRKELGLVWIHCSFLGELDTRPGGKAQRTELK